MDGRTRGLRGRLACHCLLLETSQGLVLLDTGLGLQDVESPTGRLSHFFLFLLRPELRREMTAHEQIRTLGFDPKDVRDIVLTHLDFDHAGGLDDFPSARVHMLLTERDAAFAQQTWLDRQRYRPQQWSSQGRWQTYEQGRGDPWFGFQGAQSVRGLGDEVLLVPLLGHTLGHAGIAIKEDAGWSLLAGDAFFDRREVDPIHPRCTPGLRLYQWMMEKDRSARLDNQHRLRELRRMHGEQVRIFGSHDPIEFEQLAGRPLGQPISLPAAVAAGEMRESPSDVVWLDPVTSRHG